MKINRKQLFSLSSRQKKKEGFFKRLFRFGKKPREEPEENLEAERLAAEQAAAENAFKLLSETEAPWARRRPYGVA